MLRPRLIPDATRSGRGPNAPRTARRSRPGGGIPRAPSVPTAGPRAGRPDRPSTRTADRCRPRGRPGCRSPSRGPPGRGRPRRGGCCRGGSRRGRSWPAPGRGHCVATRRGPRRRPGSRGSWTSRTGCTNVAHDVERLVVDRLVLGQPDGRRYGHRRRSESGDDAELAAHVVGRRQDAPERRASQHPGGTGCIVDPEGEVRSPSGDQVELERRLHALDVFFEPSGDVLDVDAFNGCHDGAQPTLWVGMPAGLSPFSLKT